MRHTPPKERSTLAFLALLPVVAAVTALLGAATPAVVLYGFVTLAIPPIGMASRTFAGLSSAGLGAAVWLWVRLVLTPSLHRTVSPPLNSNCKAFPARQAKAGLGEFAQRIVKTIKHNSPLSDIGP